MNPNRIVLTYEDDVTVIGCYTLTAKDGEIKIPKSSPERPVRVFYVSNNDWARMFRLLEVTPAECKTLGKHLPST